MGVLRVKVGGNWVDVGGSNDPLWVDPLAPSDPNYELWYDTGASSMISSAGSGPEASRPAASTLTSGLHYFATDTGREFVCDGTGWICLYEPLQTYAPATTNISFGASTTIGGKYVRRAGRCIGKILFYMGASGTAAVMGTGPLLGVPFPPATDLGFNDSDGGNSVMIYDATGPRFYGTTYQSGSNLGIQAFTVSGTAVIGSTVTASVPMVWAFGDYMFVKFDYLMNTPYL
jgi:hypothetical protein